MKPVLLADIAPPDEPIDTTTLLVLALVALAIGVAVLAAWLVARRGGRGDAIHDPEVAP